MIVPAVTVTGATAAAAAAAAAADNSRSGDAGAFKPNACSIIYDL